MVDPKQRSSEDEEEVAERKPELASERLKDLIPKEAAEEVKGGATTPAQVCECGTA